jgi:hypothetical protein
MDFDEITYQLNDLPGTYKRPGSTYQWWVASLNSAMYRYTNAGDSIISMASFTNATGKWLNAWGQLLGNIQRINNNTDSQYKAIIQETLLAGKGPPFAIHSYIDSLYSLSPTVFENFPNVGWYIKFAASFPQSQYDSLAKSLDFVRPAGIPFNPFYVLGGGLYLGTINYLGRDKVTGSYLGNPVTPFYFTIPSSTNNSTSSLPTLFLTDPTINPGIPQPVAPTVITTNPSGTQQLGSDAYTNFSIVAVDPNGTLAGGLDDKAFLTTNNVLYICTTAGTTTTAVWAPVSGTA